MLTEVARTTAYSGMMGTMGFDSAGDTTLKLISVYQWPATTAATGDFVTQIHVQ